MKFDETLFWLGLVLAAGYILFGCYMVFGHEKVNAVLAAVAVLYVGAAIWLFIKERFLKGDKP